jgi:predicted metal-dependent peptidase
MDERLVLARFRALHDRVYFAPALAVLQFVERPQIGTLSVDAAGRCYYDPALLDQWSVHEVASVLIHAVEHLLCDHHGRCQAIHGKPELFNLAGDFAINSVLVEEQEHPVSLPLGALVPADHALPEHLAAEQYYGLLEARAATPPRGEIGRGRCGSCASREQEPWEEPLPDGATARSVAEEGVTPVGWETVRREVAKAIREQVQSDGGVPAGWRRWAAERLEPKADPYALLRDALRGAVTDLPGLDDYSYRRRSHRQVSVDRRIVLPGTVRVQPRVAFLIDTSGSMTDRMEARAVAEVHGVLRGMGFASRVDVYPCDARVQGRQTVWDARQIKLFGGGETSMSRGLEEIGRHRPPYDLVICLTDMLTCWPEVRPVHELVIINLGGQEQAPGWPCRIVDIPVEEPAPLP